MMRLLWSAPAEADLDSVAAYWLRHNPDGLPGLTARIDDAAAFLRQTPAASPLVEGRSVRKWRVRGTDYLLLYRTVGNTVEILRVAHGREDWRHFL